MLSRDLSLAQLLELRGRPVYSRDGDRLGKLRYVVYDQETGRPEWIAIRRGVLWPRTMLAPAGGCVRREDGLRVRYRSDLVRSAKLRARDGLDPRASLYRHYGLELIGLAPAPAPSPESMPAGAVTVRRWVDVHLARQRVRLARETIRVRRVPVYEPAPDATIEPQEVVVVLHDEEPRVSTRVVAKEHVFIQRQSPRGVETEIPLPAFPSPAPDQHSSIAGNTNGSRETA